MQIEELDALLAETATEFNERKVEEGIVKEKLAELDSALKRLQGKHAAYEALRQSWLDRSAQVQTVEDAPNPDPAGLTPDPFKKKPNHVAKELDHASN